MTQEELVRRCAYAVAVVTGVDPAAHTHVIKGDDDLQKARKLWVHLVAIECGVNHSQAARLLARNRETIIINLREVADWRDAESHPRAGAALDDALESMGDALHALLGSSIAAAQALPTPIERSRINRRRAMEG